MPYLPMIRSKLWPFAPNVCNARAILGDLIMADSGEGKADWQQRIAETLDDARPDALAKRRAKGFRTARENLEDLCDTGSFDEYGQLAVAAQRLRKSAQELRAETPADGVLTGIATINADCFGAVATKVAVVINDFTVLAGTQGIFHHKKLDRLLQVARRQRIPVVMFTEGGGGRPGDVDDLTIASGLTVPTFATWASLSGIVPRIAVNNGYCFAGNAALFGCADITIATRSSWIGMAGPAMIEGGGLGRFEPKEIGPVDIQSPNGVIDIVVDDEAAATEMARRVLGYFQGNTRNWSAPDQETLAELMPKNRRLSYKLRPIINTIADEDTFVELRPEYGRGIITGFIRIEGKPIGLLANDCSVLAGAIDADAAEKAGRFLRLCDAYGLPLLSLCDTPGFMVGPDSEKQASVRRMSRLFVAGASVQVPWVCVVLRKAYGLGAMAMCGGSLTRPDCTVAWPQGEFGAMGLEGAVQLGFKKELEAEKDEAKRRILFDELVDDMYTKGSAVEAAAFVEIDAVIDPADTRRRVLSGLGGDRGARTEQAFVDVW
jgi:acetyl-CoA carboxylase carboxyltransferase component